LRRYYTCRSIRAARRWAIAFAGASLLAGCSLAGLGAGDVPATTGSIVESVEVERPLPPSLAYSDAAKIGETARAALWKTRGGAAEDWVNTRTGSSGTLTAAAGSGRSDKCRPFSTTVTSLAGVHQYSGAICQADDTRTVLKIAEESGEGRS
jgi:surface antigen